jgi:hypothetical protein
VAMDQTNIMTYFEIRGDDFPVEYVTERLGSNPSRSYKKGDEIIRTSNSNVISTQKRYRTYTSWQIGTDYIETLYGNEQAKKVIAPLLNKINDLLEIKEKYDCQFVLIQVPIIEHGLSPALGYDKEIIDFCSEIGASIEIDLYVNN